MKCRTDSEGFQNYIYNDEVPTVSLINHLIGEVGYLSI